MATRHRILTRPMVVAALLVGVVLAVVSVPVAAMLAAIGFPGSEPSLAEYGTRAGHAIVVTRRDALAGTRWHTFSGPEGSGVLRYAADQGASMGTLASRPRRAETVLDGQIRNALYTRVGWPLESAACVERFVVQQAPTIEGGRRVRVFGRTWTIPYRPIWPGLLANTLFYAAIALTPMVLLRWRRTRRRRARGLCVACGYELGEGVGVCPECGLERAMGTGQ